jgi:predicted NBD/HSP70 family sugar kinase
MKVAYSNIQRANLDKVLKLIFKYKRINRREIIEILNMSPSSLVHYLKILMGMQLVREVEVSHDQLTRTRNARDASRANKAEHRRMMSLELNPDNGLIISVSVNKTDIEGGVVSLTGEVLKKYTLAKPWKLHKTKLVALIDTIIERCIEEIKRRDRNILGIGICIGGYVDMVTGISHEYLYATKWKDVNLKDIFESKYNIPCFVGKDIEVFALGEKHYGRGIACSYFLTVWLGEDIGMGIVANGEVYRGHSGSAGELGHTRARRNELQCYCGHKGCLETIASEEVIINTCREGLRNGVLSEITDYCADIDKLTIEDIIAASNNGDIFSRNIFEAVGEEIGLKLSDVANLFNPELIILRGPTAVNNIYLYETIKRFVLTQSRKDVARNTTIVYAEDNEDIKLKGVAGLIINSYFLGD